MYRPGLKIKVKTYLGDIREGIVKEVLADGNMFVEIDEQVMPDLNQDVYIKDNKGRPYVIYRSKFPNWQAWVKPEWVVTTSTQENKGA